MNTLIQEARAVVFDVGNVLLSFCPEEMLPRLLPMDAAQALMPPNLFVNGYWKQLDAGTLPEIEVAEGIASSLGDASLTPHVLTFIQQYHTLMHPLPAAALVPALKRSGKKVYVLSNYGVHTFARTQARFPRLFGAMDGMVISGREKLTKPDPRIYQLLVDRYALCPSQCVYIDDLPENVQAAREAGFQTILYTGEAVLQ